MNNVTMSLDKEKVSRDEYLDCEIDKLAKEFFINCKLNTSIQKGLDYNVLIRLKNEQRLSSLQGFKSVPTCYILLIIFIDLECIILDLYRFILNPN